MGIQERNKRRQLKSKAEFFARQAAQQLDWIAAGYADDTFIKLWRSHLAAASARQSWRHAVAYLDRAEPSCGPCCNMVVAS